MFWEYSEHEVAEHEPQEGCGGSRDSLSS